VIILNLNKSPIRKGPSTIVFEDGDLIHKAKSEGIISENNLVYLHKSSVRNVESINSLESLAVNHCFKCFKFDDGFYDVRTVARFLSKNNIALERRRNVDAIYIDSDGLDISLLHNLEFQFGEEDSIHTTLQPFTNLLNEIESNIRLYRGKNLKICFIQPNMEALEYKGMKEGSIFTKTEKMRHIKFNSFILGERDESTKELVCRANPKECNPKKYLKRKFNQSDYEKLVDNLIKKMGNDNFIRYNSSDFKKIIQSQTNSVISFSAYVAKDNRGRPNRNNFKSDGEFQLAFKEWKLNQKKVMDEKLKLSTNEQKVSLFRDFFLYRPLIFHIHEQSIIIKKSEPEKDLSDNYKNLISRICNI